MRLYPRSGSLRVPAGGSAAAGVRVTAGEPGTVTVPITVIGQSLRRPVELARTDMLVTVPYAALSDAFDNVAVTTDSDIDPPSLGTGFDGAGSSYSAEALAGAGVTPGTEFTVDGVTVPWPDLPVATPNNVVANGQSVAIGDSGRTIGVLAAASYGPARGDWVVHYTDGTSTTVRLSTPDWSSAPPGGSTVLASMDYRNNAESGRSQRRTQLFFQAIEVDPARTVAAVTLPVVSDGVTRGDPALHVFDIAVG